MAFSPDDRLIASGGDDGQVVVWDMATGRDIEHLKREEQVRSVIFGPRDFHLGPVLVSGRTGWGGEVTLQNLNNGDSLVFPIRAVWTCVSVALDRSGRFLAASDDKTLRVWDVAAPIDFRREGDKNVPVYFEFNPPPALPDQILWIAFHPSAKKRQIAVGCRNGDVRLFQIVRLVPNGIQPDTVKIVGHQGAVNCVKYNRDGSLLATAGDDTCIRLWDANGKEVRLIGPFRRPVNGLAFSPDGNLLASANGDNTVRRWDAHTWEELKVLADHSAPVMGVDISSDGRCLASCSRDLTVIVYNLRPNALAGRKKVRP